jgi:hypothetical protein
MVAIGGRKRAQLQVQAGVKKGLFFQSGYRANRAISREKLAQLVGPIEDTAA